MPAPAAAPYPCPACDTPNAGYAVFCRECGEPLDPDRAGPRDAVAPAPPWRRPEIWLGALLVLAVLGFAAWDWRRAEAQAATYQAGMRALAAGDWDAAAAAFGRLGDYQGADRRYTEAREQVTKRDAAYQTGREAAARQDWLSAYRAFATALTIQPAYRDTQARYDQARERAPRAALAHTVYRQSRNGTAPPGLYVTGGAATTARQLPGSDAWSEIWATNPAAGRVIYDGPEPEGGPAGAPPDAGRLPPGRRFWLAGPAVPEFPPVPLPPEFERWGVVQPAPQGVWWHDTGHAPERWTGAGDPPGALPPQPGTWLGHLRYFDATTGSVSNRLPPGDVALLDYEPAAGALLLGRYNLQTPGTRRTQLVRLAPGGHEQTLLDLPGIIYRAEFSSGADALFYIRAGGGTERGSDLGWIDLRDPSRPPAVLYSLPRTGSQPPVAIQAAWVPGPGSRLLVRGAADSDIILRLYDLGTRQAHTLWQGPRTAFRSGYGGSIERYILPPDGSAVIFTLTDTTGRRQALWQPLDPARPPVRFLPPSRDPFFIRQVMPAPDGVALLLSYTEGVSYQPWHSAAVYHVARGASATAPAMLLAVEGFRSEQAPQFLPAGVVAWPTFAGLHLRPFDSGGDLPAVPGIDRVWPLPPAEDVVLRP
jgi:hypothetical protein